MWLLSKMYIFALYVLIYSIAERIRNERFVLLFFRNAIFNMSIITATATSIFSAGRVFSLFIFCKRNGRVAGDVSCRCCCFHSDFFSTSHLEIWIIQARSNWLPHIVLSLDAILCGCNQDNLLCLHSKFERTSIFIQQNEIELRN